MNKKLKNILLDNDLSPTLKAKVNRIVFDMEADERAGRIEKIELRVTPAEKMQIVGKAVKSGHSTSAFIRDVLLERIARIEMI